MFYYFGYGSNLSVVSLRAKGVDPLSSEPGILSGWRLVFDIPDFFAIEGGTGNIRPERGHAVHGVVHACRDAELATLDKLEALGITYERVEVSVITYGGRRLRAFAYVGLPECTGEDGIPSERYRNILVDGATDMRLQPGYVEWLRSIPTVPRNPRARFELPDDLPVMSLDELLLRPSYVGLWGAVFDMAQARPRHAYLRTLLGGTDATLLFLRRMDTSVGTETFGHVRRDELDDAQRCYLNEYLHEFAREYRLVARLDYRRSPSSNPPAPPGSEWGRTDRPPALSADSWRPSSPPTDRHLRLPASVPASTVLRKAETLYSTHGNENLGFLSAGWGFMPRDQPRQSLASTHAAWDQIAAELPQLYRTLSVRSRIEELPILPADEANLGDEDLLRAAAVMGILAHAYWYSRSHAPRELPPQLAQPWETVRRRLGRGPAVLSYIDLIVYNWKLRDPDLADPLRVENLELLLPTVDTDEERIFYLTQTEILARCSPIVAAAVGAQAASQIDDREAFEAELMTIIACLQRVVRESLLKINPNPTGATHVDPVVWAKTVAPFAVPFAEGVLGPSGTSSPIFNFLDIFFGRRTFESFLGREIRQLRNTYPPLWREMLAELSKVSLASYLTEVDDPNLSGLWREALEAYAGDQGFLGRHRMKVYGYLELAFKVGRSVTIGGFSGMFDDRTWDQVDLELESSRSERTALLPRTCHHVRVARVASGTEGVPEGVVHVVLDVTGTGIHYEAGDRCMILSENTPELVERTLEALAATGDETIALSDEWCAAVALRHGYDGCTELSLRDLLRFGQIRPVTPRVAEALHALSQDRLLDERMRRQESHVWELWDLLVHLAQHGFDVRSLRGTVLCEVVPPERFRSYSISSVMSRASLDEAKELALTVGHIQYRTEGVEGVADAERNGAASTFLQRAVGRDEPISIVIDHPPRFGLPRDPATPIVMIAGGTGLSPFRAFLVERARLRDAGPAVLFLGLRGREFLQPYEEELGRALADGRTAVEVAFSRDDVDAHWEPSTGTFEYRPASRRYVQDVMLQERTARELWSLIRAADDVDAAHVFVCGRSGFALSVIEALREIFRRFSDGDDADRDRLASDMLTELIGRGRLSLEIFSGDAPETERRREIDVSDIVLHNGPEYWLIIDGLVYDVTEFVRLHPGGAHVLRGYSGLDGTQGYQRTHANRTEIAAMLEMYEIGTVRKLDLGDAVLPAGETTTTLRAMHDAFVRLVYLVVEMENALRNDQSLQRSITTRGDPVEPRSPYKLERAVETHERFVASYLEPIVRTHAPRLWSRIQAVLGGDTSWMQRRLEAIWHGENAGYEHGLRRALVDAVDRDEAWVLGAVEMLEPIDTSFLSELKGLLRDAIRVFERLESRTISLGGDQVEASVRKITDVVTRYFDRIREAAHDEWPVEPVVAERVLEASSARTSVVHNRFWELTVFPADGYVLVRRTPVAVDGIEEFVVQNEDVIEHLARQSDDLGIVVDMRQARARNDPEFENAMRRFRGACDRFARVAVLIESAVGVLQVNRLSRAEGAKHFATQSEATAIKFAKGSA